jgi:hypothetical protein
VTSGDTEVNTHAALRPDGSLVMVAINTNPSKVAVVRFTSPGHRWTSAHGPVTLAPSYLTELVLRPGH